MDIYGKYSPTSQTKTKQEIEQILSQSQNAKALYLLIFQVIAKKHDQSVRQILSRTLNKQTEVKQRVLYATRINKCENRNRLSSRLNSNDAYNNRARLNYQSSKKTLATYLVSPDLESLAVENEKFERTVTDKNKKRVRFNEKIETREIQTEQGPCPLHGTTPLRRTGRRTFTQCIVCSKKLVTTDKIDMKPEYITVLTLMKKSMNLGSVRNRR